MTSHKKKKYESDSSSESESSHDAPLSEEKSSSKKSHKKHNHSSSDDSDSEPRAKKKNIESYDSDINKLRHRSSKSGNGREIDYKNRSNDSHHRSKGKKRVKEHDTESHSKETRYRDKEYEDRDKYNKDKRDDRDEREYNRGKHSYRDRYDNRERNRNQEYNKRDNDNRRKRSRSFDHINAKWGKPENEKKSDKQISQEKDKPNFGLSGKLTEETNTYRGVVIKYSEPPEARKPRRRWRLYPFKGEKALQTLYIHRESGYLIGRERKIVDLPVDHPSCSKQHAALQYRLVPFTRENGSTGKRVRPYLIDLESANGTYINNKKIEPKKYYELFERDVIKFGYSSREYVLLHENSKDEALDDDVKVEEDEAEVKVKTEQ